VRVDDGDGARVEVAPASSPEPTPSFVPPSVPFVPPLLPLAPPLPLELWPGPPSSGAPPNPLPPLLELPHAPSASVARSAQAQAIRKTRLLACIHGTVAPPR
jgi:hypothetical protein